ncbi:MerR family transcriptional regulator [Alkalihalobacillus pseudalcaliphilus]|uniref:MerR family transcriptional regulator n=1 Tax=Alkalihalobacillus pseudalcaliphilus TaxID=79884 RepID=UPI00064E0D3D|nr:MerR family transcriptional regulator [Alkalihalobacillus pseudalcaliphilus]KMK76837.1 MerR family transcriptional regulator [Alkalihalobacillus pseudalcaliphilus]
MEYTIKKVAQISGVSARTLRYYDQIGLLSPARINSSGYRIYGEKEIDKLQQILFYRSLDMKLEDIEKIISQPHFQIEEALRSHYEELLKKRAQLDQLLTTVAKSLQHHKGEIQMNSSDKFEGFKRQKVEENERKYGHEIRTKYGEEAINDSNQKWLNLSEQEFEEMQKIEDEMFEALVKLVHSKDLVSEEAQVVFEKHKKWLMFSWPNYSAEAHKGLAEMYVADERFSKYYNEKAGQPVVGLLKEVIQKYAH